MRGVPSDLDLHDFVGATLVRICIGQFEVQFHFQPAVSAGSDRVLEITTHRKWELCASSGEVLDGGDENSVPEIGSVQQLLGSAVVATDLDAPRSFALRFAGGEQLRVFDDSDEFESFSIQPGDVFV